MAERPLHVAIIGGGLCGLSLAIALTKRSISHTIYEARGSFTEIGAGINLGPNMIEAFDLIDPEMRPAILSFVTRNPGQQQNVWMSLRLGAPTQNFEDAKLIHETKTTKAGTGNMTVSRNELLKFLAERTRPENARFNKKLVALEQADNGVTMTFEDGTKEAASAVIACDGAHSTIRRIVLGENNPATRPKFTETGAYRGILPMKELLPLIGEDQARVGTVRVGPEGYIISYPIDGGQNVNVGLWPYKRGDWTHEGWIIPNQKAQMLKDLQHWGPTVQRLMGAMSDDTAFWAGFHHPLFPNTYFEGRVCLIGDASHTMGPHQGQGASQSMEDACVMAVVLEEVNSRTAGTMAQRIAAAFAGYELVRKPRFERAVTTSMEAFSIWSDFWKPDLSESDIESFGKLTDERFRWLWDPDIAGQGNGARAEMDRLLAAK